MNNYIVLIKQIILIVNSKILSLHSNSAIILIMTIVNICNLKVISMYQKNKDYSKMIYTIKFAIFKINKKMHNQLLL